MLQMAEPCPSPGDATAHFAASAVRCKYFSFDFLTYVNRCLDHRNRREESDVQPFKNGTHRLWQDGVDIVEYCYWASE